MCGELRVTLDPGPVVFSPRARAAMARSRVLPGRFLVRHALGDWGDVDAEDARSNDLAVRDGGVVLSSYRTARGEEIWLLSLAVRAARSHAEPARAEFTWMLLPREYPDP